MKHIVILFAALLALSACGNKEEAQAPVEQPVVEAETTDTVVDETAAEVVEETLEVVEESAAEEEDTGEEAIVLAVADTTAAAREWTFKEGTDYFRLVPTQPTVGGADRIEVSEVFMYSCPHCANLDPHVSRWAANVDSNVRFVRIPAIFNRVAQTHAQLFYTADLLSKNGTLTEPERLHQAVFGEFRRLLSASDSQKFFARFGVSEDDFNKAWSSFPVNQQLNKAADLVRRYNVTSVPALVVNGKYRVPNSANVLEIVDELIERESLR